MANPKDRPLSDPPDKLKPTSIKIRLAGHLVHETIVEIDPSLLPQKDDQIVLPDNSGRTGKVKYRLYNLNSRSGELIITIMLEM